MLCLYLICKPPSTHPSVPFSKVEEPLCIFCMASMPFETHLHYPVDRLPLAACSCTVKMYAVLTSPQICDFVQSQIEAQEVAQQGLLECFDMAQ